MKSKTLFTVLAFLAIVSFVVSSVYAAGESKRIQLKGQTGPAASVSDLTDLGSLAIVARDDDETFDVSITGEDATLDRISGYNHDYDKNQLASGHKEGVTATPPIGDLTINDDVAVYGLPNPTDGEIPDIDVQSYVDLYKEHADQTVTGNGLQKWGTGDSIGTPEAPAVVYVHNGKLQLEDDFVGYGILVIEDDHPGAGMAELRMGDNAKWVGLIVGYVHDSPGNSDMINFKLGNESGWGWWRPKEYYQKMLAFLGLETAYAAKPAEDVPGEGVNIIGSILLETRQANIALDYCDIYYSQAALEMVDSMSDAWGDMQWEDWKEVEE